MLTDSEKKSVQTQYPGVSIDGADKPYYRISGQIYRLFPHAGGCKVFITTEDSEKDKYDSLKKLVKPDGDGDKDSKLYFDLEADLSNYNTIFSVILSAAINGTKISFRLGSFEVGEKPSKKISYVQTDYPQNDKGKNTIHLQNDRGKDSIVLSGEDGEILIKDREENEVFRFKSSGANLYIGSKGNAAGIYALDSNGLQVLRYSPGRLRLGGKGKHGAILLQDETGREAIKIHGYPKLISLKDDNYKETIQIDGKKGQIRVSDDIILENADCAEDFDSVDSEISPGMVVVLNNDGKITTCTKAYDNKVVGVISGAGHYKPGMVLDRHSSCKNRIPVALMGKAFCKVDASFGTINVGDLLTTSPKLGHAMKAIDPFKAFGTVIGKALRPLKEGQGLIPVLIALQ